MKIRISETSGRASELNSQAEGLNGQIDTQRNALAAAQSRVAAASDRLAAAQARLEQASRIEEDPDGEGTHFAGDVKGASAEVSRAEAELEAAMAEVEDTQSELERLEGELGEVKEQQLELAGEIQSYLSAEEQNLAQLRQLYSMAHSRNAIALVDGLAARMNVGAEALDGLLQSLGMSGFSTRYSAGGGASGGSASGTSNSIGQRLGEVAGAVADLANPASHAAISQWTKSANQWMAKYQQSYASHFGAYLSPGKLTAPLSQTMTFTTIKRDRLKNPGLPDGVLGYNTNTTPSHSYIFVGTGHEKQTAVHERLHFMSTNGGRSGVGVPGTSPSNGYLDNRGINEAITEMLTEVTMGADYGPEYSGYSFGKGQMKVLTRYMGESVVYQAYFQNQPQRMQNAFESVVGPGSWRQLSEAFDASQSSDYPTRAWGESQCRTLVHQYVTGCIRRSSGGASPT